MSIKEKQWGSVARQWLQTDPDLLKTPAILIEVTSHDFPQVLNAIDIDVGINTGIAPVLLVLAGRTSDAEIAAFNAACLAATNVVFPDLFFSARILFSFVPTNPIPPSASFRWDVNGPMVPKDTPLTVLLYGLIPAPAGVNGYARLTAFGGPPTQRQGRAENIDQQQDSMPRFVDAYLCPYDPD